MSRRFTKVPVNSIFEGAKKTIQTIKKAKGNAYIVGGAVRNLLLSKEIKDIDIVCDLEISELQKVFPNAQKVGAAFGVIIVKESSFSYEIASCREERHYLDGRHPEIVKYTKSFEVDSKRRDFTLNALLLDVDSGEVIDYNDGLTDLESGVIRTVGVAIERFGEDYLRMLRAIRFAALLGFELEDKTMAAIKTLSSYCCKISPERSRAELDLMLNSSKSARAVRLLSDSGILREILIEVDELKGVTQHPIYHPEGDVFIHTLLMLEHMVLPSLDLAWSVLLHDVGKKACWSEDENGIHFYSHEVQGAKLARQIMERLRFSTERIERVEKAITNHMRFANIPQMKENKLLKIIGDSNFALELELNRLDCISCHGLMSSFTFLLDKISQMSGDLKLPKPLIKGRDLLAFGFVSGPKFSKILNSVYDAQLSGEIKTFEEARKFINDKFSHV